MHATIIQKKGKEEKCVHGVTPAKSHFAWIVSQFIILKINTEVIYITVVESVLFVYNKRFSFFY